MKDEHHMLWQCPDYQHVRISTVKFDKRYSLEREKAYKRDVLSAF
jgi:hypothetical protein